MSWDEVLYEWIGSYIKKRKRKRLLESGHTVLLEDLKNKLSLLARAVTGADIRIYPAEKEGGYKNNNFFLPEFINLFPDLKDNYEFYIFRTLYLSCQYVLRYHFPADYPDDITLQTARNKARTSATAVLELMQRDFPRAMEKHLYFKKQLDQYSDTENDRCYWLYGKWMKEEIQSDDKADAHTLHPGMKKRQQAVETVLKAKSTEELKTLQVDKKQQEDNVLTNNYEKIETLEEFGGGTWRDFDGSDELEEHENALDEIKMNRTVRVDDPVHSIYQAEFMENVHVSEVKELHSDEYYLTYDEWDDKRKRYKKDYCKVFPKQYEIRDEDYYRRTVSQYKTTLNSLRKILADVNNKYHRLRRQTKGNEFDLDAVIDMLVTAESGHTPTDKIYLDIRKREKDLSILFLLDISLSSDSYAAGNRVIDVEKQVSIIFGEILHEFAVDFSIACFYSKTRNHTEYITLKDFDTDWNSAKYVIGSPQPLGYTRIGTALRHAGAEIAMRDSANKWVILISDGKPNDYDRYEGNYGIKDTKQALREMHAQGIRTYALAIEARAKYYLPQMFGVNHYEILTTPLELIQSLTKLYERIRYNK